MKVLKSIFPTLRQFKGWSLPSKAGYIGTCITIVGLLLSFFLNHESSHKSDISTIDRKMNSITSILNRINYQELQEQYNLGFAAFQITGKSMIYLHDHKGSLEIDWLSAKLIEFNDEYIKLVTPTWSFPNNIKFSGNTVYIYRKKDYSFSFTYNNITTSIITCENNIDNVIVIVGFKNVS